MPLLPRSCGERGGGEGEGSTERWGQQDIMSACMRTHLQHTHHTSGRKRQPTGPKPSATASRCAPCSLTHCPQACKQEACAGRAIRRQAPEHSPPPPLPPHLPAQEDRDTLTMPPVLMAAAARNNQPQGLRTLAPMIGAGPGQVPPRWSSV